MTDHDEKDVDALVQAVGELIEWFEVKENPYLNDVMTVIKRKYAPFSDQKKRVPRVGLLHQGDCTYLERPAIELLPGRWLVNGDTGKAAELEEGYIVLKGMLSGSIHNTWNIGEIQEWIESERVEVDDGT